MKTGWARRGIMAVPLMGWLYVLSGLVRPFEAKLLRVFWWVVVSLNGGLHACQLPLALPVGRKLGLSSSRIIAHTMLFGAAWWKPLKTGMAGKRSLV